MKTTILAACLVALLAATPAMAQADFTMYAALGDSVTAGFASGSLMDWYQDRSYPAVIAAHRAHSRVGQPGTDTGDRARRVGAGPAGERHPAAPLQQPRGARGDPL